MARIGFGMIWFSKKIRDKNGMYSPMMASCRATLEVETTTGWEPAGPDG